MPFKRNTTDGQMRTDRGSDSAGKRKKSSLSSMPWTPSQLALKLRFLALEGANFWFPLSLDENWIKGHFPLPMLHVVMDVDLSRFKTIVSERPGQLWAGSSGGRWKDFCYCVGFTWRADWQSHFVVQWTRRWPCGSSNTARFWENWRKQWPPPWTTWWTCWAASGSRPK